MDKELEAQLKKETDPEEIKKIIELVNLDIKKKDMLRLTKLNDLQDDITNQMSERIKNRGDEFNNKDLLDYYKTIQETLTQSTAAEELRKLPQIQINQQNITVAPEKSLSQASRNKILDVVKTILAESNNSVENLSEVVDKNFEENTNK